MFRLKYPAIGDPVFDHRGRLLLAALGFAGLPMLSYDRALWALRSWLDSWPGIGAIATGMARQGYDTELGRYDEKGWRATSTRPGWSTRSRAPRPQRGNARRGMPSRARRGTRCDRPPRVAKPRPEKKPDPASAPPTTRRVLLSDSQGHRRVALVVNKDGSPGFRLIDF